MIPAHSEITCIDKDEMRTAVRGKRGDVPGSDWLVVWDPLVPATTTAPSQDLEVKSAMI